MNPFNAQKIMWAIATASTIVAAISMFLALSLGDTIGWGLGKAGDHDRLRFRQIVFTVSAVIAGVLFVLAA